MAPTLSLELVRRRLDNSVIGALWCSHCNALEAAASCRVCRCAGGEDRWFVSPHAVCAGCAEDLEPELLSDLYFTSVLTD